MTNDTLNLNFDFIICLWNSTIMAYNRRVWKRQAPKQDDAKGNNKEEEANKESEDKKKQEHSNFREAERKKQQSEDTLEQEVDVSYSSTTTTQTSPKLSTLPSSAATGTTEKGSGFVEKGSAFVEKAENTVMNNIPGEQWQKYSILIGVAIVILGICFFCIRRCFRKRRGKDGKKGMKGVDLKSVQLLGSAYKEKVQQKNDIHLI